MAKRFGEDWLQKARAQHALATGQVKQSEFERNLEKFGIPPLKREDFSPTIRIDEIKKELKKCVQDGTHPAFGYPSL